ncbi:MAG: hypothetical protein BWY06_00501 [Candidatus Latescibacteria bacterium ADurb.Bin168]|nr:MAG: hypothetical protein BWY06_00501 [Candidatus Latescibacteria bacterium ADurb.Bin168]
MGRLYLCAFVAVLLCQGASHAARAAEQPFSVLPFDSALSAATDAILTAIAKDGVPCDVEGAFPVALWPAWRHRPNQSLVAADRGFGEFLSNEIERRLPCRVAVRGNERDALLRELQLEAQPFYDSSHPRFRMAGSEFVRSLYLIAGDWWEEEQGRVVFTAQVCHLLQGQRLVSAQDEGAAEYSFRVGSISNQRVRESLALRVAVSIPERFDADALQEVGTDGRPSLLQAAIAETLAVLSSSGREILVADDTTGADAVVSGEVTFLTCQPTPMMQALMGNGPSFGYRTVTELRIRWASGRAATWSPTRIHPCPALQGPVRRRTTPDYAYLQARTWATESGAKRSDIVEACAWVASKFNSN